MKIKTRILRQIFLSTIFLALPAQSQTNELVKIVNVDNPKFTVPINSSELQQLLVGIDGFNNLPIITIDKKDLFDNGDIAPMERARNAVRDKLIHAAEKLVDLRAIAYHLAIKLELDVTGDLTEETYKNHRNYFSRRYSEFLGLFLNADAELTAASGQCVTDSCAQEIYIAQTELYDFGDMINRRLIVGQLSQWQFSFEFHAPLIREAIASTLDKVWNTNDKDSDYEKLLQAAWIPFAAAAKGVVEVGKAVGDIIVAPKAIKLKLFADATPLSNKAREKRKATAIALYSNKQYQNLENGTILNLKVKEEVTRSENDCELEGCGAKTSQDQFESLSQMAATYKNNFTNLISQTVAYNEKEFTAVQAMGSAGTEAWLEQFKMQVDSVVSAVPESVKMDYMISDALNAHVFYPEREIIKLPYKYGEYSYSNVSRADLDIKKLINIQPYWKGTQNGFFAFAHKPYREYSFNYATSYIKTAPNLKLVNHIPENTIVSVLPSDDNFNYSVVIIEGGSGIARITHYNYDLKMNSYNIDFIRAAFSKKDFTPWFKSTKQDYFSTYVR